jgi:hypothetical protein
LATAEACHSRATNLHPTPTLRSAKIFTFSLPENYHFLPPSPIHDPWWTVPEWLHSLRRNGQLAGWMAEHERSMERTKN